MTEQNRQFDDLQRQVSDRFRSDLRGLFEPTGSVPPQVDGAILEQARRRLTKRRPMILRFRWAAGIAAAAAVIALVAVLHMQPATRRPQSVARVTGPESRIDLDGNGRVDILDAFRLAKGIESRGPADSNWDINGDGRINRADVDTVAFAAVRLGKGV
ncbi:MAG: dockerin type I domain-containing protein [Phycisphaerales bacterium]